MGARPLLAGAVAAASLLAAAPPPAGAADPGRWKLVKTRPVQLAANQGVTTGGGRTAFTFTSTRGLFRASRTLRFGGFVADVLPPEVVFAEGYDHIGDLTFDPAAGGRFLLPLECFRVGAPNRGNHCGTGSIGVASARTLAWRYYVKLDPRDIKKAMWAELSPDGRSLWTQAGSALLRYDARAIRQVNAAPAGPMLRPTLRLRGALPPGQVTGATFVGERLYVATQRGRMRVHSIDVRTGDRRLEIERDFHGESEGLATLRTAGGTLHWLIAPFDPHGRPAMFGRRRSALLTFARRG